MDFANRLVVSAGLEAFRAFGGCLSAIGAVVCSHYCPRLCRDCCHQPLDANQRDHSLDVVSQHVLSHFRAHTPKPPSQEMTRTSPSLDRAERMLDGRSADHHRGGRAAASSIGGINQVHVLPPRNPPFMPRGATALEFAARAGPCPIAPHLRALLLRGGVVGQGLQCRAAIDIGTMFISEICLHKMPFDRAPEVSERGTVAVIPAL